MELTYIVGADKEVGGTKEREVISLYHVNEC